MSTVSLGRLEGGRRLGSGQERPAPLATVIVTAFNRAKVIGSAIESVLAQGNVRLELIVIDGGSTDGTVDVIRKYDQLIDYWVSEKDRGIAHAYAKGVQQARGQWVYFLGSDDTFASPGVFNQIARHLTPDVQAVVGLVQRDTGTFFRSSVGLKTYFVNTIHHQGAFYARALFDDFSYDESIRVCEDYELNFRLALRRAPVRFIDVVVSVWSTDGASSVSGEMRYYKNMYRMRSKYLSPVVNCLCFLVGWANVLRHKVI